MANSIAYSENDTFVVLEPNQPEQYLSATELLDKLITILSAHPADLSADILKYPDVKDQAQYLLDTFCELNVGPGNFLQWFAVRLEK